MPNVIVRPLSACVCFAALVVASAGAGANQQTASSSVPRLEPGVYTRTLQSESGPSIHYAISVPPGYSESARVPLVLALHFGVQGGPGNGAGRALIALLVGPALADLGAVIVAPDSLGGSWETKENQDAALHLMDEALKVYHADPKKLVVTGFSMGGRGTWVFAAKFPDRFSAAIPVAGRPPEDAGKWKTPVFAVHSRRDELVAIGPTNQLISKLQKDGVNAELVLLDRPSHFQVNLHADGLKQAVPWLQKLWK